MLFRSIMTHFLTHIILHAVRIFWQRHRNCIICLVIESALHVYKGQLSPWFEQFTIQISQEFTTGLLLQRKFIISASGTVLSKCSTSRFGVSKTLELGLNIMSSLCISLTFRFCLLLVKYKSSFISTFSEYTCESTGLWN